MFTEVTKHIWLEALKSGKFRWCKENLSFNYVDGKCHCALGVLAAIHRQLSPRGVYIVTRDGVRNQASTASLTWYNPRSKHFEYGFGLGPKTQSKIAELNDQGGRYPIEYIESLKSNVSHK